MELAGIIIGLVIGLVVGGAGCWALRGSRISGELARQRESHAQEVAGLQQAAESQANALRLEHQQALADKDGEIGGLQLAQQRALGAKDEEIAAARLVNQQALAVKEEEIAGLKGQLEQAATAQQLLEQAKTQFAEQAKLTSAEALKGNNDAFLKLANENLGKTLESAQSELNRRHLQFQELVKPLSDNYNKLNPQIESLVRQNQSLMAETGKLSSALTDNRQVGQWGEVQLRRVVELAGMTAYSDFSEQSAAGGEGQERPDLIVKLPEGRTIVVDAKSSVAAALEAHQAEDEAAANAAWLRHAAALKNQVNSLARKNYGRTVEGSLEFVVMFVPGDQFLAAALKADPSLIDYAMQQKVALATPPTLVAMLWAVANGWQKWEFGQHAEQILAIGNEMHDRLIGFIDKYGTVRQRINQTVSAFNDSVGTLESRVLVSARRMAEMRAVEPDALKSPAVIDAPLRQLRDAAEADPEPETAELEAAADD